MTSTDFEPAPLPKADELVQQSKELVAQEPRGLHTGVPAYRRFSEEMTRLIGSAIMPKNFTKPELYYVLEVAAAYGLSPFTKEIWAARMTRNAEHGPITILIGEAGLLAIAQSNPHYRGNRALPVYENDEFRYLAQPRQMPDGTWSYVEHSFSVTEDRGKLLGAWCEVYRDDRPPEFFWAPIEQYEKQGDYSPWGKQRDRMIVKCARANGLRAAFRISGAYVADEMSHALLEPHAVAQQQAGGPADFGDDPVVAAHLADLFAALEVAKPGVWSPARVRLELANRDAEGKAQLIRELEEELVQAGVEPPAAPDPEMFVEGEVVEETDEPDEPGVEGPQARLPVE